MTETSAARANFEGLEVVTFESRHATEMATLIARYGGVPRVAPSLARGASGGKCRRLGVWG